MTPLHDNGCWKTSRSGTTRPRPSGSTFMLLKAFLKTFWQTTRSTRGRAFTFGCIKLFLIKEKEGGAADLHSSGMRPTVLLYAHAQAEDRHRAHSLSPPGKEAAADPEPRGSPEAVGGASESPPREPCLRSCTAVDSGWPKQPQLKVSDIDSARHMLKVRRGKGRKDRQTLLA